MSTKVRILIFWLLWRFLVIYLEKCRMPGLCR